VEYLLHILIIAGIYMILSLSLNLVIGFTGLPALGHAAFSCVGAYTSSLLALNYGISPWIGLFAGALLASIAGALVSFPAIRLKGDYFALASFGFAIIVYSVSKNWISLTRGPLGLPGIPGFSIFGIELTAIWAYLLLTAWFVVITYVVIRNINASPFGRILRAVREDEIAAEAMGKNVNRYKLIVLMVGAFFAGIAGSLYAHYITFIDPSSFTVMESITILLMVVFGGLASLPGSLIGALTLVVLPEILRFLGLPSSVAAPLRQMIYGFLLVVLMLRRPQGVFGRYRFK
jgi:branched-chain amino acid transport system permease protein